MELKFLLQYSDIIEGESLDTFNIRGKTIPKNEIKYYYGNCNRIKNKNRV